MKRRKKLILLALLLCLRAGYAQRLADSWKPVPAAISAKAPLPPDVAEKYAKLAKERSSKYLSSPTATPPAVASELLLKKSQYLRPDAELFRLNTPTEGYRFVIPDLKLVNSSHGREKIKTQAGKFNPKRDRISYAVITNGNEIRIVNHDHKYVDMSEFNFFTSSEAITMEDNKIVFLAPILSIAQGQYPWLHQIVCTHALSDAQYTFDLQLVWPKEAQLSGETRVYALSPIHSETADNLGVLCDLESRQLQVVQLPFLITADGKDGANGRRGHTGAAGTDTYTYKDKEGNSKTVKGTCGKAGEDGTDGQDGTDGGRFLFCISPEMMSSYGLDGLVATIDAGTGGKGGKAGKGGKHGKGSGCDGKDADGKPLRAADGKDGKDGKDGRRGDFLYVLSDVNGFYQSILP